MKTCNTCKQEKDNENFNKNSTSIDDLSYDCKKCACDRSRKWRENNPKKVINHRKIYKNRSKIYDKKRATGSWIQVINHYGAECVCCGEKELLFLTIDHVNNDGNKHRKELNIRGGYNFYRWVIENNFPDILQILCYNCNYGKNRNKGECPHKNEKYIT